MKLANRVFNFRVVASVVNISLIFIMGCGDSEAEEKVQALEAARNWANENTQVVVSEVVAFIASGIPGPSLLDDLIAEQVIKLLSWEFSEPEETGEGIHAVLATVSTSVELDLPVVGEKKYKALLCPSTCGWTQTPGMPERLSNGQRTSLRPTCPKWSETSCGASTVLS